MAHIPPPSRVPCHPSLYASAGSMADFYDEPMYAAAPHPTVPLFRGAVPARVLASTPGTMRPASTAGDGLGFFQRFGVGSWRVDHKSWWRVARRYGDQYGGQLLPPSRSNPYSPPR